MRVLKSALVICATVAFANFASAKDKYTVALDGTFAPHAMPKLGGGLKVSTLT